MRAPFQPWFEAAASALVYSVCGPHASCDPRAFGPPYNDLTLFVLDQWRHLPDFLRLPMKAATLLWDSLGRFKTGQPFHQCQPAARAGLIQAARSSRGFSKDLLRYYESLATLALHSRMGETPAQQTPTRAFPGAQGVLEQPASELLCEIAVVGSGPGGAITACLLAEAGKDVLLLEEGPCLSLGSCAPFSKEEMIQKYRNRGQTVALGANKVAYAEGCCVGGGSEINSGLYHRAPAGVLERWSREFKVQELSERELVEHFEACERDLSVSPLSSEAPAASLKLVEGAGRLGWKSIEVPRCFRGEAVDAPAGGKQSMTETYVPRFLAAGGRLLPTARIESLRQQGTRWVLHGTHKGAGRLKLSAETVFVCAGAMQSPVLLRRSGITKNIGNSLRLHPTLKVLARFRDPVNSAEMGVPVHQVKEFAPALTFGGSISSPPFLALGLLDYPAEAHTVPSAWTRMANYYAMTAGESTGTVRPVPGHRDALVRYRLSQADRCLLAEGLRKLCALLFSAGAECLFPSLSRQAPLQSAEDLRKLPNDLPDGLASLMTIHLFSSCPMGEDPAICATNSFGRVHGFDNLFVNDASLLCGPPGVNPQGTVMALARRNTLRYLSAR